MTEKGEMRHLTNSSRKTNSIDRSVGGGTKHARGENTCRRHVYASSESFEPFAKFMYNSLPSGLTNR